MKIIKRVIGIILIVLGIGFTGFFFLGFLMELDEVIHWGVDATEMAVLLIAILLPAIGGGIVYWGIGILKIETEEKKANKQNQEKTVQAVLEVPETTYKKPAMDQRFTMLVEDVFEVPTAGIVLRGVLINGVIGVHSGVWLLRKNKIEQFLLIEQIEAFSERGVNKTTCAQGDGRIGILIKEMPESAFSKGDIVTNIKPNITDINSSIENPRLKGLIAGRGHTKLSNVEELIENEIADKTKFLVLITEEQKSAKGSGPEDNETERTLSFPFLTTSSGEKFQPLFTDWVELGKWGIGNPAELKTMVMDICEAKELFESNDALTGIVVNPFTDNYFLM